MLKKSNISSIEKHRLISSGVLLEDACDDINYLRLRQHYCATANILTRYKANTPTFQFPIFSLPDVKKVLSANKTILQKSVLTEMLRLSPTKVTAEINRLDIVPVHSSKMSERGSIFYGLAEVLYKGSDLYLVAESLIKKQEDGAVRVTDGVINLASLEKGLRIQHPDDDQDAGHARAVKLFYAHCQDVLETVDTKKEHNYDTLDYDKIDWRKIMGHRNFDKLLTIHNTYNQSILRDFLVNGTNETLDNFTALAALSPKRKHSIDICEPFTVPLEITEAVEAPKDTSSIDDAKGKHRLMTRRLAANRQPSLYAAVEEEVERTGGRVEIGALYHEFMIGKPVIASISERIKAVKHQMDIFASSGCNMGGSIWLDMQKVPNLLGASSQETDIIESIIHNRGLGDYKTVDNKPETYFLVSTKYKEDGDDIKYVGSHIGIKRFLTFLDKLYPFFESGELTDGQKTGLDVMPKTYLQIS